MKRHIWVCIIILPVLSGCGALEPKYYPDRETITSKLFPTTRDDKTDQEFEKKISQLLSGDVKDNNNGLSQYSTEKKNLFTEKGRLLVVNNLSGVDSKYIEELKEGALKKNNNLTDVEAVAISTIPNLQTLRLMGARQRARYVLVLNSFSNTYRYHNAWTIPTLIGMGVPYFFLETQTIKIFAKVEYSLIDIKENVILSNESVTSEAESKAILPESGIVEFKTTNTAITDGMRRLTQKFIASI